MLQDGAELFDGAITSFTMSEKGPMAIVAFGLPGQAHDDDAVRAVRLAHRAHAALAGLRIGGRAAVTFGLAYCGVVGNRERKDYTIIGDAINRAAKLVSRMAAPALVCDQAIAEKAGQRIAFEPLSEPEGLEEPLFQPVLDAKAPSRRLPSLRGRETEMSWLQRRLDEVRSGRTGLVLYLEGEAGIGKSTLMAAFAELARDRFDFFWGGADIFAGAAAPFAAWRPIFAQIFPETVVPDALLTDVLGALARQGMAPERTGFASVVLPLLPAEAPDDLQPDDVAQLTCETLAALLRGRVAEQQAVLVLVLLKRGVRFAFFHHLTDLHLDPTRTDINQIDLSQQVQIPDATAYVPLYDVKKGAQASLKLGQRLPGRGEPVCQNGVAGRLDLGVFRQNVASNQHRVVIVKRLHPVAEPFDQGAVREGLRIREGIARPAGQRGQGDVPG